MKLTDYLDAQGTGARAELARNIKVAPAYLYQMETGIRPISAPRALQIGAATGWSVTPHELRPDIYPNPTDGVPQTGAVA